MCEGREVNRVRASRERGAWRRSQASGNGVSSRAEKDNPHFCGISARGVERGWVKPSPTLFSVATKDLSPEHHPHFGGSLVLAQPNSLPGRGQRKVPQQNPLPVILFYDHNSTRSLPRNCSGVFQNQADSLHSWLAHSEVKHKPETNTDYH